MCHSLDRYAQGAQTHPLASYFLVRSSIALRLLSGAYRRLILLDYEDFFIGDPIFPLVLILNAKKSICIYHLPLAVLSLTPPAVTNAR